MRERGHRTDSSVVLVCYGSSKPHVSLNYNQQTSSIIMKATWRRHQINPKMCSYVVYKAHFFRYGACKPKPIIWQKGRRGCDISEHISVHLASIESDSWVANLFTRDRHAGLVKPLPVAWRKITPVWPLLFVCVCAQQGTDGRYYSITLYYVCVIMFFSSVVSAYVIKRHKLECFGVLDGVGLTTQSSAKPRV